MQTPRILTRIILLATIPLGWVGTESIFVHNGFIYLVLNVIAFFAVAATLRGLVGDFLSIMHLWVIFLTVIVGYFVKFYILCTLSTNQEVWGIFLERHYPLEQSFLNQEFFLLYYFKLITAVIVCMATLANLLPKSSFKINHAPLNLYLNSRQMNQLKGRFRSYLLAIVTISISLIAVTWIFQIGEFVEGRTEAPLPFRLGGLVFLIQNGLLPITFLAVIFLSNRYSMKKINRNTVFAYVLFGVLLGFVTTSKAILLVIFSSLILHWIASKQMTSKRIVLILIMLPAIGLFNVLLSVFRGLRSINSDVNIFELMQIGWDLFMNTDIFNEPGSFTQTLLILILRINGADSLLNILDYAPIFSWDRSINLVINSSKSVAEHYSLDILGWPPNTNTAFSPSLLGYLFFVFPTTLGVCIGFIAYVLFWQFLITLTGKITFTIKPVVIIFLSTIIVFYTSEGTLESIPQRILGFLIIVFFVERMLKELQILNKKTT